MDRAFQKLSLVRQRAILEAIQLRERDLLLCAKKVVARDFTRDMETATYGNDDPRTGAAAMGRWDELLGMWYLTRSFPIELDHRRIAARLERTKGAPVAQEYLRRAEAFEKEWEELERDT